MASKTDALRGRLENAQRRVEELRGLVRHLEGEVEKLEQARVEAYEHAFAASDASEAARYERDAERLTAKIAAARNRVDEAKSQLTAAERVLSTMEEEFREARKAELTDLCDKLARRREALVEKAVDALRQLAIEVYRPFQDLYAEWREAEDELARMEGRSARQGGPDVNFAVFLGVVVRDAAGELFRKTGGTRGYPLGLNRHSRRWGCEHIGGFGPADAETFARHAGG